ncbi:19S proteasome regulatory subunit Rpn8 [Schizosaccharomyces pombe]|uniref:26S proteasome regulatory subunit rpn8 n=1 Tax=Schizosaccharomyces pombe (strain 972 / ATCC 24843) TaxID=284812 RepID=RPN8_SCHPO|nr:putative proteasome regulatory subunit Rpn8 [Schizosaccharomyces pombe]O74440.1 RecName: Full=26S proteasome regulatory subunit rpn8 [Schizosaccharomyces pombe 972h-]CAA20676.1 19S proteasome regulatory subunit Rpn8 (predicted) [Schizosaccharomyces pombe]|eukprot:NP_587803.1 putative proteasome regulatory subunit Rpn8 [Schizosaccharomyces pombe]
MPPAVSSETSTIVPQQVIVHPLVLLSAVDSYNRSAKGTKRRVVGILLGQNNGDVVNVANSYAIPFEEDEKNASVWFLDHNFMESMNEMFKKINANEKLVGWYHTGPQLRPSDLEINNLLKKYIPNPVLVIIDVKPKSVGLPTNAYFAIDEIEDDGSKSSRTFVHLPSSIEAEEAEEIGVEHLLRDTRDASVGTLATRVTQQAQSLQGLGQRLTEIADYLRKVVDGQLPINHAILAELQSVFNLLPNIFSGPVVSEQALESEAQRAFNVNSNDQLMSIYISSIVRAVIALHDLLDSLAASKAMEQQDIKPTVQNGEVSANAEQKA